MADEREHLASDELLDVLSNFDIGALTSIRELARGSRHAPKLLIQTPRGEFLLKRRAAGRDRLERVLFSHDLLQHLYARGFPVVRLVAAPGGETVVERNQRIYELFAYTSGEPYDYSLTRTTSAGQALFALHEALTGFSTPYSAPDASFHDLRAVRIGLNSIPTTTASHDSVIGHEAELLSATQILHEQYDAAAEAVTAAGFASWLREIVHGDWHPGNLLFRKEKVSLVLDLDSARWAPRVIDVANGILQFSIIRAGVDPLEWPAFFDEARMRRFFIGYQARGGLPIEQRRVIPKLMIESLIAESVVPIAATGSIGVMPGFGVLMMVRRKVRWMLENEAELLRWMVED